MRPKLSKQTVAARSRAKRERRVDWLCRRLDKYVDLAESFKPRSKMRAAWMAKAEAMREELKEIDH